MLLVGCGGDDTSDTGAGDAGADTATDSGDSGGDDGGDDGGMDGGADTGADADAAMDASDPDASSDADADGGVFVPSACLAPPGTSPVAIGDYADEVIAGLCQTLMRCSRTDTSLQYVQAIAGDEARCRTALPRVFNHLPYVFDGYEAAVAAGTVTYDPAQAGICMAFLGCGCRSFESPFVGPCRDVFTGTVTDGAECPTSAACSSVGAEMARCESGALGDPRTCRAYRIGEEPTDGMRCSYLLGCADGLYCDGDTERCRPLVTEGMACVRTVECQAGLTCEGGGCLATTVAMSVGEECNGDSILLPCDPLTGLVCVEAMSPPDACVAYTDGLPGSPCIAGPRGASLMCAPDSRCISGTCVLARDVGETCMRDDECASYSCAAGSCAARCI